MDFTFGTRFARLLVPIIWQFAFELEAAPVFVAVQSFLLTLIDPRPLVGARFTILPRGYDTLGEGGQSVLKEPTLPQ